MADLRGRKGSVTWGGADGPVVANITLWTMREENTDPTRVTRPGDLMHRYSFGAGMARGILRVVGNNTDATPPIPTGTVALLTLLEDTSPAQSYAFKASLFALNKTGVDSASDSQQWTEYSYISNATSNADTFTVV